VLLSYLVRQAVIARNLVFLKRLLISVGQHECGSCELWKQFEAKQPFELQHNSYGN
jgi:hypothetical protein